MRDFATDFALCYLGSASQEASDGGTLLLLLLLLLLY